MRHVLLSPTYRYIKQYDLLSLMAFSAVTISPKPYPAAILYSGCICDGDDRIGIDYKESVG